MCRADEESTRYENKLALKTFEVHWFLHVLLYKEFDFLRILVFDEERLKESMLLLTKIIVTHLLSCESHATMLARECHKRRMLFTHYVFFCEGIAMHLSGELLIITSFRIFSLTSNLLSRKITSDMQNQASWSRNNFIICHS